MRALPAAVEFAICRAPIPELFVLFGDIRARTELFVLFGVLCTDRIVRFVRQKIRRKRFIRFARGVRRLSREGASAPARRSPMRRGTRIAARIPPDLSSQGTELFHRRDCKADCAVVTRFVFAFDFAWEFSRLAVGKAVSSSDARRVSGSCNLYWAPCFACLYDDRVGEGREMHFMSAINSNFA